MADTTQLKKDVEFWFREKYLADKYPDAKISQDNVKLDWGGEFEYDAVVYLDGRIHAVYLLSCSEYKTQTGKNGAGKFHKIKSDVLMMTATTCLKKVMVFFGETMFDKFKEQQKAGRLPPDVEAKLIYQAPDIEEIIFRVRKNASDEVSP